MKIIGGKHSFLDSRLKVPISRGDNSFIKSDGKDFFFPLHNLNRRHKDFSDEYSFLTLFTDDGKIHTTKDLSSEWINYSHPAINAQSVQQALNYLVSQSSSSFGQSYTTTLPDTFSITISEATHEVPSVNGIRVTTPDGQLVSVVVTIFNNDVTLTSNVSLLNHILKIF